MHMVAQSGNVNMLRTLIYAQADINLPDGKSGKTALHHAVDNNDLPVAGFLLTEVTCILLSPYDHYVLNITRLVCIVGFTRNKLTIYLLYKELSFSHLAYQEKL